MRILHWIRTICSLLLLSQGMGLAHAAPENGWWWNPGQSGRGFSIEVQGDTMFLAGYFYESDGRATWLASAGPMQGVASYQGRLSSYGNGQTLTGDYRAPSAATDAGAVSVQFIDDTHATLTWPGGTVSLERFRFGGAPAGVQPETGWWWNPSESGRGVFFEVQGNQMFTAGYMYNASGQPVWYASAGPMSSATRYQGRLDQYANGQTLTGAYRAPGAPVNAGSITAEFSAVDRATVTLADAEGGLAAPPSTAKGSPKMFTMERYRYGKVAKIPRPKLWKGTFQYTFETGSVGVSDFSKLVVNGTVTWVDESTEEPFLSPLNGSTQYRIFEGRANSDFSSSVTTTTGGCPGTSTSSGTASEALSPSEGNLNLAANDTFSGALFFPVTISIEHRTPCATGTLPQTLVIFMDLSGKMVFLNMSGDRPDQGLVPGARVTSKWSFDAQQ